MRLHDSISKGILPEEHMPQCQQTLLVTGAKSLIFVCSNGDRESMAQLMVYPDYYYFTKIDLGWADFKRDLDNYGAGMSSVNKVIIYDYYQIMDRFNKKIIKPKVVVMNGLVQLSQTDMVDLIHLVNLFMRIGFQH